MGWWGFGVVEGDEPLDLMPSIVDAITGKESNNSPVFESDEEYDRFDAERHALLVEKLKAGDYASAITRIQNGEFDRIGDRNIALQVLGELIVVNGGVMTDETKAIVIEAAENDEWAKWDGEGSSRYTAMQDFIERVKSYQGVALEPTCRGLFATIEQAVANNEPGLVNK